MNFKYDINDLKKEVEILRNKKGFNIVSYNPNNKELDINLFSKEKSYSINFYLDTSQNTNFFKKNFDISISKIIPKKVLQEKVQFYYNSYPFLQNQTLSNFFESLQKNIEEDEEINNYFEKDSLNIDKKRKNIEKKIQNQKNKENN